MSDAGKPGRVIVFEDDADLRGALTQALQIEGYSVVACEDVESFREGFTTSFNGVVISDIRLPGADGRQLFRQLRSIDKEIPVVLMTGHGELQEAVDLMREGVYDFISKPFSSERLLASVRNALEHRALIIDNRRIRERQPNVDISLPLLGDSELITGLRTLVRDIANTDVSVLILGETGTGKDAVARALHDLSDRRSRHFSVLDCASLPDQLLEAELFGIEESVAGMRRHKPGRIEAADKGTLFLDSIDCLQVPAQGRLLRAVEDKRITALGATSSRNISCRIVSAANQDLRQMVKEGRFRSDLYFRLNTVIINLPPLRERREDIPALFVELLARAARRLRRPPPILTKVIRSRLLDYPWPGNIRELSHYADQVVLGLEKDIEPRDALIPDPLPDLVDKFEASLIKEALRKSAGSVKHALEILQIPRKTFYDKVARYGIDLARYRE